MALGSMPQMSLTNQTSLAQQAGKQQAQQPMAQQARPLSVQAQPHQSGGAAQMQPLRMPSVGGQGGYQSGGGSAQTQPYQQMNQGPTMSAQWQAASGHGAFAQPNWQQGGSSNVMRQPAQSGGFQSLLGGAQPMRAQQPMGPSAAFYRPQQQPGQQGFGQQFSSAMQQRGTPMRRY